MRDDNDGTDLVFELARLTVDDESLDETLRRVARMACQSSIGADTASVTLSREPGPRTPAFRGDIARLLDGAQYISDCGPCLTAYRMGEVVRLDSIKSESARWPEFAAQAAAYGIQSSLSLPLIVRGPTVGALNLYSRSLAHFTDASVEVAQAFAQQAAVVITNGAIYWRTCKQMQDLEAELEDCDRIGQAKGILIATHHVNGHAALDLLRHASQNLNRTLRDVADEVVHIGLLPETTMELGRRAVAT